MRLAVFTLLVLCPTLVFAQPRTGAADHCEGYDQLAVQAGQERPRLTFVFVDRSSSAAVGFGDDQRVRQALGPLISTRFVAPGSHFEVHPVHARTAEGAWAQVTVNRVALPEESEFDADNSNNCSQTASSVRAAFRAAYLNARSTLQAAPPEGDLAEATDLWGVLEVVSNRAPHTGLRDIKVVVFSDLMECMPEPRRCFEHRAPASLKQAEAWAQEDAARLQDALYIDRDVIATTSFHFHRGDLAATEGTQALSYYWRSLLGHLGVPRSSVRFD